VPDTRETEKRFDGMTGKCYMLRRVPLICTNNENQVWNYPIYEITKAEYKEKTNQTDEAIVEIKCELKYWNDGASSLYYQYNVVYDNNGIAFNSTTNDWLEHPSAQENHKRPDSIWMPKVKTSVDAFWGGRLNYSIIRNIVPEP